MRAWVHPTGPGPAGQSTHLFACLGSETGSAARDAFLDELRLQFPLLHEHLELTRVERHGLLFRWPGVTTSRARPSVSIASVLGGREPAPRAA